MEAKVNYGPFTKGEYYTIINEGLDWYLVRNQGKSIYTPKWVF